MAAPAVVVGTAAPAGMAARETPAAAVAPETVVRHQPVAPAAPAATAERAARAAAAASSRDGPSGRDGAPGVRRRVVQPDLTTNGDPAVSPSRGAIAATRAIRNRSSRVPHARHRLAAPRSAPWPSGSPATVNRPERLGRLLLVLVVADGNVALLGERARGSHCLAPGAPVAGRLLPRALQVRCGITRKPAHIR